jgi:hypothetical protein
MLQDRVMLGFSVARVTAVFRPKFNAVIPEVERWHPSLITYNQASGEWQAYTEEGYVCVLNQDGVSEGWIVNLMGERLTSHMEGAIRALASDYVGQEYAERDTRRHGERMGQGIVEAMVPALQSETQEARDFSKALSRIGSNGLIVSPQYSDNGEDPSPSYGIKLHFPPPSGMEGLLKLEQAEASRLRLRILGQDTTSKDSTGGGHARAQVGAGVRQDLLEGDAAALDSIASQLFDAWAALESRDRNAFPLAKWDATPPADEHQTALTRQSNATATTAIVAALPAIQAAAEESGLKLDIRATLETGKPVFMETEE